MIQLRSIARKILALGIIVWGAFILASWFGGNAAAQGPIVSAIRIEGNQRVEEDAIKVHITQREGQPLEASLVDSDIKSIYQMGFFDNVGAVETTEKGREVLIYRVKERPQITDVKIEGMKAFRPTDDKVVAAIKVHSGSILDPVRSAETRKALKEVYENAGYLDARVSYRTISKPDNTAIEEFDVVEGPQVRITKIVFSGNKAFSSRELRGQLETGTHNFLSFVTGSGILDHKKLRDDVDRLGAFYYDHGYLNVHVNEPEVERHGTDITLKFDVDEGPVYRVGTVGLGGDLKFPRVELEKLVTIKPGDEFRGTNMQHVELQLSDFYSNRGYAFVSVDPKTQLDPANRVVNIMFDISPGREVLVNRIQITGNTKTSDKVIRREMQLQEQEPYSAEAIRDSKKRLDRLGFFSDTRITTTPSPQPDKIDLNVAVSEANTASLQVAGGFDSYQSVFGRFVLGNTNLFGGGEAAMLNAEVGFLFQSYSVSYTEPWFMDIPLSVTTQLFSTKTDLQSFHENTAGGAINTYYPLTELGFKKLGPLSLKDVNAGLGYQLQSVGITGLSAFTTLQIREFQGYTLVSEIMPSIKRFTVDNPTDPRSGDVESLNLELAGIGAGEPFVKGVAHARWFYTFLKSPTFGQWVFSPGITFGIGTTLNGDYGGELPLYTRFFPGGVGGMGDVRGYQLYSLGPYVTVFSQSGSPNSVQNVGGSKELLLSNEITFPILSGLGIRGVLFIDAGQAYELQQSFDLSKLQAAAGFGVRWRSPFGPLAVNLAFPINPRPQDQGVAFEIGAGSPL